MIKDRNEPAKATLPREFSKCFNSKGLEESRRRRKNYRDRAYRNKLPNRNNRSRGPPGLRVSFRFRVPLVAFPLPERTQLPAVSLSVSPFVTRYKDKVHRSSDKAEKSQHSGGRRHSFLPTGKTLPGTSAPDPASAPRDASFLCSFGTRVIIAPTPRNSPSTCSRHSSVIPAAKSSIRSRSIAPRSIRVCPRHNGRRYGTAFVQCCIIRCTFMGRRVIKI